MEITLVVMKRQGFAVVSAIAALLIVISVISTITPESVSAYQISQAGSQSSACGNGEVSANIGCQNTISQIQGDENSVASTAQQTFPEVKPPPTSSPCEDCLIQLLEQEGLASEVAAQLGLETSDDEQAIMDICEALLSGEVSIAEFSNVLPGLIPQEIAVQIIGCIDALL
jgi:hypothetical protein